MRSHSGLLLLLLVLGLAQTAPGQAPESLSFQGHLTDGATPLDGSYDLTFALYDAATGGAMLWTATRTGVVVSEGVYDVVLGPDGTPPLKRVPFIDPLWLEVSVGGQILSPRSPVSAVPYALGLRGVRVIPVEPSPSGEVYDAPSIIEGHDQNRVSEGIVGATIGGGGESDDIDHLNTVAGDYGTVSGGFGNWVGKDHDFNSTTSQPFGTVGGGKGNSAAGVAATVAGGQDNWVFDDHGFIGGGEFNKVGRNTNGTANETHGVVAGGEHNFVFGPKGAIGGGGRYDSGRAFGNVIYDLGGVIAGGADNTVGVDNTMYWDGQFSSVGGGLTNRSLGPFTAVGGGQGNDAKGSHAVVAGGQSNRAWWARSAVGGGTGNEALATASTIGGGASNIVYDEYGTVSGGESNAAGTEAGEMTSDPHATVGGGYLNRAAGAASTVGGGSDNRASGQQSTVAGGDENSASGRRATIGGGSNNRAWGGNATVAGGAGNLASGNMATVPGGFENEATESFAFAAGRQARALHKGAFVWADSSDVAFESTGKNQFLVRASGGLGIGTNAPSNEVSVTGDMDVTGHLSIGATHQHGQLLLYGANGASKGLKLVSTQDDRASLYWIADAGLYFDTYRPSPYRRLPIIMQLNGGDVGIGTDAPSARLEVVGNVKADNISLPSDARLKTNVAPIEDAIALVGALRGVTFTWRSDLDAAPQGQSRRTGVIAQEVQAVLPDLVHEGRDGYLSVDYLGLIPVLIEAVTAQQHALDAATARIEELEAALRATRD